MLSVGATESVAIFEQSPAFFCTICQVLMPPTLESFGWGYEHFGLFDRGNLRMK